jgi:uncharacterized membrane protein YwaF
VVAPLALLTLNRWLRATLYFWAFALTTQAFIQPALEFGPALALFWWFWVHDLCRAYAVSAVYLAIVVPLNIRLGSDYGYLGNLPAEKIPPFVAALGPWPARAIILVALAATAFVLVELPWHLAKHRRVT